MTIFFPGVKLQAQDERTKVGKSSRTAYLETLSPMELPFGSPTLPFRLQEALLALYVHVA